jgi:hypothetical protein
MSRMSNEDKKRMKKKRGGIDGKRERMTTTEYPKNTRTTTFQKPHTPIHAARIPMTNDKWTKACMESIKNLTFTLITSFQTDDQKKRKKKRDTHAKRNDNTPKHKSKNFFYSTFVFFFFAFFFFFFFALPLFSCCVSS